MKKNKNVDFTDNDVSAIMYEIVGRYYLCKSKILSGTANCIDKEIVKLVEGLNNEKNEKEKNI